MRKFGQTLRASIRGMDTSRQLAAGVAFGLLIGIIPKDSLLPYALAALLLVSRANLLTTLCTALIGSLISGWLVPITHELGKFVLEIQFLRPFWSNVVELPIIAWLQLDNTIVTGSLTLGLLASFPLYLTSIKIFDVFGESIFQVCRNCAFVTWLVGPTKPVGRVENHPPHPHLSEGQS